MSAETLITWLIVGLVAGVLASLAVGGTGYGLLGSLVVGVIGAFFGGFLFRALHITVPVGGLVGSILVAFIGAVLLLLLVRLAGRRRAAR